MWGPWAPAIDGTERRARLRALQALVMLFAGPAGEEVARALRRAETDPTADQQALSLFDALPSRARRNALASYARLHSPCGDRT